MNKKISREMLEVLPRIMDSVRNEMRAPKQNSLTMSQFRAINHLSENAFISNKELAEWMGISAATLTRIIDILSAKRFLKRKHSALDKRRVSFVVTPLGMRTIKYYRSRNYKYLEKRFQFFTELESKKILDALGILKKVF